MSVISFSFFLLIHVEGIWGQQPPTTIQQTFCTFDNGVLECPFDTTNIGKCLSLFNHVYLVFICATTFLFDIYFILDVNISKLNIPSV